VTHSVNDKITQSQLHGFW